MSNFEPRARSTPRRRPAARGKAAFLHRWLGLTLGAIFALTGLTGSYLAFYPELETAAIAPLRASPGVRPASIEAVYARLTQVASPDKGGWNIELPAGGGVITSRYSAKGSPIRMVSVDPSTLAVVRDVRWGSTLSTWLYEFHYHLLMGRPGATIAGVFGLLLLAMTGAGILLWWRSGRTMRSRLRYVVRGTRERHIHDIHRLMGIGASALLIPIIVTAVMMSLPKQTRPLLGALSPIAHADKPRSTVLPGRERLPIDSALAIARRAVPDGEMRWVGVPHMATAPYTIRFWKPGGLSHRFPKNTIWIDQYSGRVLGVRDERGSSPSDRILAWLYPLHSGQAFGLFGRSVVVLLGLVPLALFITGFLRWRAREARIAAHRRRIAPTPK